VDSPSTSGNPYLFEPKKKSGTTCRSGLVLRQGDAPSAARSHYDTRSRSPTPCSCRPPTATPPNSDDLLCPSRRGGSTVLTRAQENDHWLPQRIAITPRRSERRAVSSESQSLHLPLATPRDLLTIQEKAHPPLRTILKPAMLLTMS